MQEVNIVVSHFEIEKQADYHLVLELVWFFFIIISNSNKNLFKNLNSLKLC